MHDPDTTRHETVKACSHQFHGDVRLPVTGGGDEEDSRVDMWPDPCMIHHAVLYILAQEVPESCRSKVSQSLDGLNNYQGMKAVIFSRAQQS